MKRIAIAVLAGALVACGSITAPPSSSVTQLTVPAWSVPRVPLAGDTLRVRP